MQTQQRKLSTDKTVSTLSLKLAARGVSARPFIEVSVASFILCKSKVTFRTLASIEQL
jgi:hypothetical protein